MPATISVESRLAAWHALGRKEGEFAIEGSFWLLGLPKAGRMITISDI